MDESGAHYAKGNEPVRQRQILYSLHVKAKKKEKKNQAHRNTEDSFYQRRVV